MLPAMAEAPVLSEVKTSILLTAMDVPVQDSTVHDVGRCRMVTVQHVDCGLIWADYPSDNQLSRTKKARRRRSKKPAASKQPAESMQETIELVLQLQELGLPSAFGTSKGEAYDEEDDSCIASETVQPGADHDEQEMFADAAHSSEDSLQEGSSEWQQAYDATYGCFYYYKERTQETQWEPPSEGFLPAPTDWLASAQQEAAHLLDQPTDQAQQSEMNTDQMQPHALSCDHEAHPSSAEPPASFANGHGAILPAVRVETSGMMASIPASQGRHIRFDDSDNEMEPDHDHGLDSQHWALQHCRDAAQHSSHQQSDQQSDQQRPLDGSHSAQRCSAPYSNAHRHLHASLQPSNAVQHSQQSVQEAQAVCARSAQGRTQSDALPDMATAAQLAWEDSEGESGEAGLLQAAVQGIMASTVVTSSPTEQAAPLSNIVPDTPDPPLHITANSHNTNAAHHSAADPHSNTNSATSHQQYPQHNPLAVGTTPSIAMTTEQGEDQSFTDPEYRQDASTNAAAIDGAVNPHSMAEDDLADGGGVGITYSSLSNHLQSNRELPRKLWKYWLQRYSLFQRFDEGILMDEEGWYSATPEVIAAHHATKCRCSVVVDAFAGVGGNAIQFALTCDRVIAVELCAQRLETARHNAAVYGVADKIEFICGDFLEVASTLEADRVFLSPPWGGPAYSKSGLFDVSQEIGSLRQNLSQLLQTASSALKEPESKEIVCFLPRNTDLHALGETVQGQEHCLVERNVLNSHLKAVTVYYGSLASL